MTRMFTTGLRPPKLFELRALLFFHRPTLLKWLIHRGEIPGGSFSAAP